MKKLIRSLATISILVVVFGLFLQIQIATVKASNKPISGRYIPEWRKKECPEGYQPGWYCAYWQSANPKCHQNDPALQCVAL
jgi:hypothetical protein